PLLHFVFRVGTLGFCGSACFGLRLLPVFPAGRAGKKCEAQLRADGCYDDEEEMPAHPDGPLAAWFKSEDGKHKKAADGLRQKGAPGMRLF
ncbi:MAG: hypothetical protein AB3N24_23375, partial [Leisingera sp.]